MFFPDHHVYTSADMESAEMAAAYSGADLITVTEKDAVKMLNLSKAEDSKIPLYVLTDRLAGVAESLPDYDIIVNVQGDEPLIDPNVIDLLAKTLVERAELDMVTVATPLKNDDYEDPSAVKVVVNQKGEALYFSRALIPYPRHDFVVPALKHVGIYAYRREFLLKYAHMKQTPLEMTESLEQLRALESGHKIGVITVETEDIGIDTEEDLKKVNAYFERSQL